MQLNLLLAIRYEKNGMEKSQQGTFFKTNVPFVSFLPFILRYVKTVLNFQSVFAIIFHIYFQFFIFGCYKILTDLVLEIIKNTEKKI